MTTQKQSTWREYNITLPAQTVYEHVFLDTTPNHYMINNLSVNDIYLGIKLLPDTSRYDMKVTSGAKNITARDEGVKRISLYNAGSNPAQIILTTFEDKFNPAVLSSGANVTVTGGGGGTSYDGIIRGYTVALPAGNNKIGVVDIGTMPTQTINLNSLPAGSNNIGKVDINSMPSLPVGANRIGDVGIQGGVTITSMPPVQVSSQPTATEHQNYEASIGTTETVWTFNAPINMISYIKNDDSVNDVFISFGTSPITAATSNGAGGTIRLKAGESISDINRVTNQIRLIRAAGTGTVRFVGY
jgi:hypothetical protein